MSRTPEWNRPVREVSRICGRSVLHLTPLAGNLEIIVDDPVDTFIEDVPVEVSNDPEPVEIVLADLPDPCDVVFPRVGLATIRRPDL